MAATSLAWLLAVSEDEQQARLRELRLASRLILGPGHPATQALDDAVVDPGAATAALTAIDELPALPKRRLLAVIAQVLP